MTTAPSSWARVNVPEPLKGIGGALLMNDPVDDIKKTPQYKAAYGVFLVAIMPLFYGFMSLFADGDFRLRGNWLAALLCAVVVAALPMVPLDLWARWDRRRRRREQRRASASPHAPRVDGQKTRSIRAITSRSHTER
jgi:hypothetical protein